MCLQAEAQSSAVYCDKWSQSEQQRRGNVSLHHSALQAPPLLAICIFLYNTKSQVMLIVLHNCFSEMRELETLMWNKIWQFNKCPSKLHQVTDCQAPMYLAQMCLRGLS